MVMYYAYHTSLSLAIAHHTLIIKKKPTRMVSDAANEASAGCGCWYVVGK